MSFQDYIKPELLLLVPILMGIASQMKKAPKVPDWVIPFTIDLLGIFFAGLFVGAQADSANLLMAVFTGTTQGLLCSLAAIGLHQTVKQTVEKV